MLLVFVGNFRAGDNGTILKKACDRERDALSGLMLDVLKPFVPLYTRQIEQEGEGMHGFFRRF